MTLFAKFIEFCMLAFYFVYVALDTLVSTIGKMIWKPPQYSLAGKTVVVTGGAGYIGKAIARKFCAEQCNLAVIDVHAADLESVVSELKGAVNQDIKIQAYVCDLTNPKQITQTFSSIRRDFGRVDVLVNNAGIVSGKSVMDLNLNDYKRMMDVNCFAHVATVKEVLTNMISDGGGHIVSVSSVMGMMGMAPNISDYVASKFAVTGFMEAIDYELHSKGIDSIGFTTVCPYMVQTPLFNGCVPSRFHHWEPILSTDYVASSVIEGVKENKRIVILPPKFILYVLIKLLFPRQMVFRFLDFCDVNTSMTRFQGRN